MIRVIFDSDYIRNLEDYYRRNECIREQQYLSQDKLLHLAAFCLSKVPSGDYQPGEATGDEQQLEAALDAIRQLSLLCEKAAHSATQIEPITIVNGHAKGDGRNQKFGIKEFVSTTWFERRIVPLLRYVQTRI